MPHTSLLPGKKYEKTLPNPTLESEISKLESSVRKLQISAIENIGMWASALRSDDLISFVSRYDIAPTVVSFLKRGTGDSLRSLSCLLVGSLISPKENAQRYFNVPNILDYVIDIVKLGEMQNHVREGAIDILRRFAKIPELRQTLYEYPKFTEVILSIVQRDTSSLKMNELCGEILCYLSIQDELKINLFNTDEFVNTLLANYCVFFHDEKLPANKRRTMLTLSYLSYSEINRQNLMKHPLFLSMILYALKKGSETEQSAALEIMMLNNNTVPFFQDDESKNIKSVRPQEEFQNILNLYATNLMKYDNHLICGKTMRILKNMTSGGGECCKLVLKNSNVMEAIFLCITNSKDKIIQELGLMTLKNMLETSMRRISSVFQKLEIYLFQHCCEEGKKTEKDHAVGDEFTACILTICNDKGKSQKARKLALELLHLIIVKCCKYHDEHEIVDRLGKSDIFHKFYKKKSINKYCRRENM